MSYQVKKPSPALAYLCSLLMWGIGLKSWLVWLSPGFDRHDDGLFVLLAIGAPICFLGYMANVTIRSAFQRLEPAPEGSRCYVDISRFWVVARVATALAFLALVLSQGRQLLYNNWSEAAFIWQIAAAIGLIAYAGSLLWTYHLVLRSDQANQRRGVSSR